MKVYSDAYRGQTIGTSEGDVTFDDRGIAELSDDIAQALIGSGLAVEASVKSEETIDNAQKSREAAAASEAGIKTADAEEGSDEGEKENGHWWTKSELKAHDKEQLITEIAPEKFDVDPAELEGKTKAEIVDRLYNTQEEA